MKYDFIGLNDTAVVGVKSPVLVVKGTTTKRGYDFLIKVNGEEFKYDKKKDCTIHEGEFDILIELPKNARHIEVLFKALKDKEWVVVYDTKTSFLKRLRRRVYHDYLKKYVDKVVRVFTVLKKGICFLWREYHFLVPISLWKKYYHDFVMSLKRKNTDNFYNPWNIDDYQKWLAKQVDNEVEVELKYKPKISMVIPVYNVSGDLLSECLDSILNQTYTNFEICLADDKSTNKDTIDTLKEYEKKDKRIKVVYRKENGHISRATNSAIEIATGEFVGLMDNDDIITKDALYQVVKCLNEDKTLDMIYSDEDKLDMDGRFKDPHFKSDFAPDTLISSNYICHFCVLRKSVVDSIGGFRVGYEGSQDHDLFLRFTEKTNRVAHIPKILYHWRMIPGSTAATIDSKSYALDCGKKSVEEALKRRGVTGKVKVFLYHYLVEYTYKKEPSISIIIPTKDHAKDTEVCLNSIFSKTNYKNYEVVLVNNDSSEKALFNLIDKYKKKYKNFRVVDANMPFNYSKINNIAVKTCKSDYIVLLNNDTKLITGDWLKIMVGYAMQKHIGTVGVKLLYPDNTVQHGGVILGVGGVASHAFLGLPRDSIGLFARLALPHDYSANTAACLMVSREKYNEVGGLEEDLMVAYNDIDFNLKLLDKGYYNVFLPQVELYHYESKTRGFDTTAEKYQRFLTEQAYMNKKWGKLIKEDPFYNKNFSRTKSFFLDK